MKALLYPFLALAALGLALSALVHIFSWAGLEPPHTAWALHIGIFVVWVPAVIMANQLAKEYKQKDWLKASFRGAPPWMRKLAIGLGGYALINFVVFLLFLKGTGKVSSTLNEFRMASGHWMAFYGMAFGILFSGLHAENADRHRKCLNGHPVSAAAKYCERCGAPVPESSASG